jgi:predicted ATP-dependent protease
MNLIFKKFLIKLLKSLNIIPVEWIDEVISHALIDEPTSNQKKFNHKKIKIQRKKLKISKLTKTLYLLDF